IPGSMLSASHVGRTWKGGRGMRARDWMLCVVVALAAAGCERGDRAPETEPGPAQGPPTAEADPGVEAGAADAPPTLEDVIEHDPRYVVGISFPPEARNYP